MDDISKAISLEERFRIKSPHISVKRESHIEGKILENYFGEIKDILKIIDSPKESDFEISQNGFALNETYIPNEDGTGSVVYQKTSERNWILKYMDKEIARIKIERTESGVEYTPMISFGLLAELRVRGISIDNILDNY